MSAMTDYLENALIDHIFRARPYTAPASLYFALFTAMPTDAGGGTEVTGGSYARVEVVPGDTTFYATQGGTTGASSGTGGTTRNAGAVQFPTPTANWGLVVGAAIFDDPTAGNMLFYGPLTSAANVTLGQGGPVFNPDSATLVLG